MCESLSARACLVRAEKVTNALNLLIWGVLLLEKKVVRMGKSADRQQQVVLNYKANGGNMKKAMIDAGYSETYADRNSKYLLGIIGDEIKAQQDEIKSEKIKTVKEIQEWWSGVMDDAEEDMAQRIKCSDLLAKSQGAYVENVNINGNINNPMQGLTTEELRELIKKEC